MGDFIRYFTEPNVPFGGVSIAMVFFWGLALGVGVYLLRSFRDSNPARLRFWRTVGTVEAVFGAIGLILLLLKALNVPVLEMRVWGWAWALAWLAYTGYAFYLYRAKLPSQVAALRTGRSPRAQSRGQARVYQSNGTAVPPREPRAPRPVATTTRREARRDKKRKSR